MKNSCVSITGATGFVGWHIAEAFLKSGWHVRGVVRPDSTRPLPNGVERTVSPLVGAWLSPVLDGSDVVVHCAGLIRAPSEAAFDAVNVEGTRAVVDAANATGARLLLISSQAAGGTGTVAKPRRESDPPAPVNAYGRSKLRTEDTVRSSAHGAWTILRPSAVYGPRDRGFLPLFRLATRGWFFAPTDPAMPFTLISALDLAQAAVGAATSDRAVGETFFVGHPEPRTTDDVLRALAEVFSRPYRPRRLPPPLLRAAAAAGDLAWKAGVPLVIDGSRYAELTSEGFVCSVDRCRDVLGFTAPTPLRDGFEQTAWWYQKEGWIS